MSKITKGVAALYAEAQSQIETWSIEKAKAHLGDDEVVFVDELPHTATGKVSKLELRKRFAGHVLPDGR